MSDSDYSGRHLGLGSSSLGTSVSGASEEDPAIRKIRELGPAAAFALKGDLKTGTQAMDIRRGRGVDVDSQQQRLRTISAPQHSQFRNRSIGSGIGSSPLASSSTPWLAGTRGRERQFSRLPGNAGLSSDGEPPSRSLSPSPDESSGTSPVAPQAGQGHPLSRSSPPLVHTTSSSPPAGGGFAADGLVSSSFQQRATTVDYKEPRRLHEDINSPTLLSTYEEPIWEVVQDMREQRMSLCQSLRQYVFVHAAIIEGALMIVDEEREREKVLAEGVGVRGGVFGGGGGSGVQVPVVRVGGSTEPAGYFSFGAQATSHLNFATPLPLTLPPVAIVRSAAPQTYAYPSDGSSVSSSTGKRGASPTELLKEGKKGEVLLSKRPSIKRKNLSEETRPPVPFHNHSHPHPPKSHSLGQTVVVPSPVSSGSGSGSGSHVPLLSTVPSSPPILP